MSESREQKVFNDIITITSVIKEKKEDLRNLIEEDTAIQAIDKDLYEAEQQVITLKNKRKLALEDFKAKHHEIYEDIADKKETVGIRKEELVVIILDKNEKKEDVEIYQEMDSGKKVKIEVILKPTFKKIRTKKDNKK